MRQELNSINYNENYIKFMFKIIIVYELIFVLFWNILYYSNSGIENWFQEKILTAIFVFLSCFDIYGGVLANFSQYPMGQPTNCGHGIIRLRLWSAVLSEVGF